MNKPSQLPAAFGQRRGVRPAAQRGVTLMIALIALVILTLGALALVRSSGTALRLSGNLAFKRDLVNQSERGIAAAVADLNSGSLATAGSRSVSAATRNYSATVLASSDQGIPNVLLNEAAYVAAGFNRADIVDTAANVTIRYVIDRQCTAAGAFDSSLCQGIAAAGAAVGGSPSPKPAAGAAAAPVYRISVRVMGPRGSQSFVQHTVVL